SSAASYKRHRFPPEIIRHAVWLYYRFTLSYRAVEEMLAQRGMTVSYEPIRYWCHKFGSSFAHAIRKRQRDVVKRAASVLTRIGLEPVFQVNWGGNKKHPPVLPAAYLMGVRVLFGTAPAIAV
ncbi:MAG: IS6 family transposase, partial [Abitibacteriaceae bacterium]|nr:IS6 family transposase [Abditibacteriaceae bacterium]